MTDPRYYCGLCLDNYTGYSLEILTEYGTTGVINTCWPCLQKRMDDLVLDLAPDRCGGTRLGAVIGCTVARLVKR